MGQENSQPQPGDLIEIHRPLYQHWALYVGDGNVIHVTDEGAQSAFASSSSISASRAKVKKEPLSKVAGTDKWRVNNKYDRSRNPRPVREIIRRAERWIGEEVPYNVMLENCEHFVTDLRYGEAVSDQVTNAVVGGGAAAVGGLLLAGVATVAMALSKGSSH